MDVRGRRAIDEKLRLVEDILYTLDPRRRINVFHSRRNLSHQVVEAILSGLRVEHGISILLVQPLALVDDRSDFGATFRRGLLPRGRSVLFKLQAFCGRVRRDFSLLFRELLRRT